ncbi:unnamed protein product, partial [Sphenostylis stenocarpa]
PSSHQTVRRDDGLAFGKWRDGRPANRNGGNDLSNDEKAVSPNGKAVSPRQVVRRPSHQMRRLSRSCRWRDSGLDPSGEIPYFFPYKKPSYSNMGPNSLS